MRIIILQEKLKAGVNIIERATAKSFSLPILKNILLKAEKNFLELTATDLEIGISWWGLAKVEEAGAVAIPGSLLAGFLSLLPNKQITLTTKDQDLILECETYKTKIKGNNIDDFPIIPQVSENEFVALDNRSFCQGLGQVADTAAISTSRPEISGIYLSVRKGLITMAATDSFRLGEKLITSEKLNEIKKEYSLIIPQKTAREIVNVFGEKEGEIRIFFGPNQVLWEFLMAETTHPEIHLTSRLIDGEYPNYQEIIPQKYDTEVVLDRNEFLAKVKAAGLLAGKINEVSFNFDPKNETVAITSQNPDAGEFQAVLSGKIKGKEEEISFNCKFIIDGLLAMKSAEVFFGLNGESGPGALKPVGDTSYTYVVMPIGNPARPG